MHIINNYRCDDEPVGQGGMGCVYRATSPTGHTVALKMLKAEYASMPAFSTFFATESRAISRMNHRNVVGIEGQPFSDKGGNLYLPMQFIEGKTIEQRVKELHATGSFMSETEATDIMRQVLDTFEYIHSQDVIHRDIKPSNIMLRPDGTICIIDFGIARDAKLPTGYTIGHSVGTDGYMSPEQVNGLNIDHRTDIYSLGCLLFYMITGNHAIVKKSNDYATRCAILNDTIPAPRSLRHDLSEKMERIIIKATDKDMRRRYSSAADFRRALEGGSSTCGPTAMQGAEVTVGREVDNDIVISNRFVSGHHLVISYNVSQGSHMISIQDRSTNGTGIELPDAMKFLKHSTFSFPFNIYRQPVSELPDVLLSGRVDSPLDWNVVIEKIKSQFPASVEITPPPSAGSTVIDKPVRHNNQIWLIALTTAAVLIAVILLLN